MSRGREHGSRWISIAARFRHKPTVTALIAFMVAIILSCSVAIATNIANFTPNVNIAAGGG